jgi:hypothetical protein
MQVGMILESPIAGLTLYHQEKRWKKLPKVALPMKI